MTGDGAVARAGRYDPSLDPRFDAVTEWVSDVADWTSSPWALFVGAGAIASAILIVGAVIAVTVLHSRSAKSLAALDSMRAPRLDLREIQLERPFVERVLEPARSAALGLGRRLTPQGQIARIERRLSLAGNPADWDVDRVIALKVLAAVFAGAVGAIVGLVADAGVLRTVVFVALGVAAGWLAPSLVIYQMAADRSERILRDLPDSLDLLTISVESGLGFDAALSYVARNGRGPMSREFARVLQEMQIGTGRAEALRALALRTDVSELKTFASAMNQADAFGVPIGRALRVQSDEMRIRRRQRAEEKAQQVPVKILFPLIFGILPVLFIAIIGPAAVQAIDNFAPFLSG